LAKATITGKQLYVFTAQAKEENYPAAKEALQRMYDSFNVKPMYL